MLVLTSCFDTTDYNLSYSWSPVQISSELGQSSQVELTILPYRNKLDSMMNEVIGHAAHDLTTNGRYESRLGTFVTALLHKQSSLSYQQPVGVALMNHHGGLRAPINAGPITLGEVFEVMPFENKMLLLEVPGKKLTEIITFVGTSSSSMMWPVSFEITASGVKNIEVDGKAVDPNRTYLLAVSDYQANGGSGFEMLQALERVDIVPVKLRDMIIAEVRELTTNGDTVKTEVANLITVSMQ